MDFLVENLPNFLIDINASNESCSSMTCTGFSSACLWHCGSMTCGHYACGTKIQEMLR